MLHKILVNNRTKKSFLLLLCYLLVSVAVALPVCKDVKYTVWGSMGDYDFSLNPSEQLNISTYVESYGGGYYAPFSIAKKVPYLLVLDLFSLLKVSPFVSTLLYVILLNTLSGIFTFISFNYFLKKASSKENAVLTFLFSLIYIYSPYFSTLYKSGHFIITFAFLFFPIVLMYFDKALESDGVSSENYLILFLLFALLPSSISNIAYIVIYLLVLGLYLVGFLLYKGFVRARYMVTYVVTCLLLFLSNSWWLLSNVVYYVKTYYAQVSYSRDTLGKYIEFATEKSSLEHLLFGGGVVKYESVLGEVTTIITIFVYFILLVSVLLMFLKGDKKLVRFSIPFLFLTLLGLFIVKGPKDPYGDIFSYLYDKIPGFQILRRPKSKVYWTHLLGLSVLALFGFQWLFSRFKFSSLHRIFAWFTLFITTTSVLLLYSLNIVIVPFNIPSAYYEANVVFVSEGARRILIIPDIAGLPPYYDQTLNSLRGHDFVPQVWKYEFLGYDLYNKLALNDDLNSRLQTLYRDLFNGSSVCSDLKDLNITHVVLKENLTNDYEKFFNGMSIKDILSKNEDFSKVISFTEGANPLFTIWTVGSSCVSNSSFPIAVSNPEVLVSYDKVSPTFYRVKLKNLLDSTHLSLMRGYDKDWKLYLSTSSYNNPEFMIPVSAISKSMRLVKGPYKTSGYVNDWFVSMEAAHPYVSSPNEVNLVLYYSPSTFLYIGEVLTMFVFLLLLFINVLHVYQKGRGKTSQYAPSK
ncbi:hypothetical protein GYA37_01375 [candidate division WWE3 bacterium]|uniref:Membrane protein 6-pyruvoyl-tetrahydropterin synthase-related domain-containing protein n=1 Tax=candidate division WWE3 bacterium TaxID=2053526 RepID=A0A7X9E730_UNCKA|nr:hypothetical protein [candidate division WWE3 bacterium]